MIDNAKNLSHGLLEHASAVNATDERTYLIEPQQHKQLPSRQSGLSRVVSQEYQTRGSKLSCFLLTQ